MLFYSIDVVTDGSEHTGFVSSNDRFNSNNFIGTCASSTTTCVESIGINNDVSESISAGDSSKSIRSNQKCTSERNDNDDICNPTTVGTVFLSVWKRRQQCNRSLSVVDQDKRSNLHLGEERVDSGNFHEDWNLIDHTSSSCTNALISRYCISGLGDLLARACADQRYKLDDKFRGTFVIIPTTKENADMRTKTMSVSAVPESVPSVSSNLVGLQGLPALMYVLHQSGCKDCCIVTDGDPERVESLVQLVHPARSSSSCSSPSSTATISRHCHPLVRICRIPTSTATSNLESLSWWKVYEDEWIIVHATSSISSKSFLSILGVESPTSLYSTTSSARTTRDTSIDTNHDKTESQNQENFDAFVVAYVYTFRQLLQEQSVDQNSILVLPPLPLSPLSVSDDAIIRLSNSLPTNLICSTNPNVNVSLGFLAVIFLGYPKDHYNSFCGSSTTMTEHVTDEETIRPSATIKSQLYRYLVSAQQRSLSHDNTDSTRCTNHVQTIAPTTFSASTNNTTIIRECGQTNDVGYLGDLPKNPLLVRAQDQARMHQKELGFIGDVESWKRKFLSQCFPWNDAVVNNWCDTRKKYDAIHHCNSTSSMLSLSKSNYSNIQLLQTGTSLVIHRANHAFQNEWTPSQSISKIGQPHEQKHQWCMLLVNRIQQRLFLVKNKYDLSSSSSLVPHREQQQQVLYNQWFQQVKRFLLQPSGTHNGNLNDELNKRRQQHDPFANNNNDEWRKDSVIDHDEIILHDDQEDEDEILLCDDDNNKNGYNQNEHGTTPTSESQPNHTATPLLTSANTISSSQNSENDNDVDFSQEFVFPLKLLVLGTGCASPSPHRGSSGYALIFSYTRTTNNYPHTYVKNQQQQIYQKRIVEQKETILDNDVVRISTAETKLNQEAASNITVDEDDDFDKLVVVFEVGEGFCTQWNRHYLKESKKNESNRCYPSFASIQAIWISHAHWDHYGGLVNLLLCIHREQSIINANVHQAQPPFVTIGGRHCRNTTSKQHNKRPKFDYKTTSTTATTSVNSSDWRPWLIAPRKVLDFVNLILDEPSLYFRSVDHRHQNDVTQIFTNLTFRKANLKGSDGNFDSSILLRPIQSWQNVRVDHSCHQAYGFIMQVHGSFGCSSSLTRNDNNKRYPYLFCFSGDTRPCRNLVQACHLVQQKRQQSIIGVTKTRTSIDFLLHEATYDETERVMSIRKKHSTIQDALMVATDINAKRVLLTHFSQRYTYMPNITPDCSSSVTNSLTDQMIIGSAVDGILVPLILS